MEVAGGDAECREAFDYLKLIVWIGAATGSWAMLIGISHLTRALMR
jgi:hypothetical protein